MKNTVPVRPFELLLQPKLKLKDSSSIFQPFNNFVISTHIKFGVIFSGSIESVFQMIHPRQNHEQTDVRCYK